MRLLTIVLSLLVFAGCQQAPTGPQGLTHADREQITALTEAHIKAVLANDASAEAALYTEDTVLLPPRPGNGSRQGRNAEMGAGRLRRDR